MIRTILVYSFVFTLFSNLCAQKQSAEETSYSVISKQIESALLNKANKEILHNESEESTKHFYSPLGFDSLNFNFDYKVAIDLYSNFQQLRSILYFERAMRHSKNIIKEAYYFLGNSYNLAGNYDKAIQNYKVYLSLFKSASLSEQQPSFLSNEESVAKNDISHRIEMCENAKRLSNSSSGKCPLLKEGQKILISAVGDNINTSFDDFGPVVSGNDSTLFFTSRKVDEGNIYFSRFVNNKWGRTENPGWPINTDSYESVLKVSPDGKRVYFYRAGINDGAVYYSDFKNNHWNFPNLLLNENEIKTTFKDATIFSFALTDAKDELFVVSDKKGGLGGKDIYVSKRINDSTWGPLENLGAPINTQYDEEAISLSPDGKTMYFSSNGINSIGGFDVFVSNRKDGHWSQPVNLGIPINTPGDDLFFSFLHNINKAVYSSSAYAGNANRDLDIYYVNFCEEVTENTIKGLAIGFNNGTITISDADAKSEIKKYNIKDGKYSIDLKVGRRYDFTIETDGILPVRAEITVPESKEPKRYDIYQEISFKTPGDTLKITSAMLDIEYEKINPDITSYSALLKKEDKKKLKNYYETHWFTYPSEVAKKK